MMCGGSGFRRPPPHFGGTLFCGNIALCDSTDAAQCKGTNCRHVEVVSIVLTLPITPGFLHLPADGAGSSWSDSSSVKCR